MTNIVYTFSNGYTPYMSGNCGSSYQVGNTFSTDIHSCGKFMGKCKMFGRCHVPKINQHKLLLQKPSAVMKTTVEESIFTRFDETPGVLGHISQAEPDKIIPSAATASVHQPIRPTQCRKKLKSMPL